MHAESLSPLPGDFSSSLVPPLKTLISLTQVNWGDHEDDKTG